MEQVFYFIICYILTFLLYLIFVILPRFRYLKKKKNNKVKKERKEPVEVRYLVTRYRLNLDKVDYKKLLMIISLVSSLDISIAVSVSLLVDAYFLQLAVAFLLLVPLIFISYHFIYKYYLKKGMIKNV
ncbi:MAG: hypothetical protein MR031_01240 [Tenericutes bacterium]|nr:hypothetical protein [Mycoplasmatota bacterium]